MGVGWGGGGDTTRSSGEVACLQPLDIGPVWGARGGGQPVRAEGGGGAAGPERRPAKGGSVGETGREARVPGERGVGKKKL